VIGETRVRGDDNGFGVGFLAGLRARHASPLQVDGLPHEGIGRLIIVVPRHECADLPSLCAVAARSTVVQPIDTGIPVREYLRAPPKGRAM